MTITVAELKQAIAQFRDDAVCYAYEGEVRGIVILPPTGRGEVGVIYCADEDVPEPLRVECPPSVAAF